MKKKILALALLLLAGPAFAAPAADTLNRGNGAEPESLDPQFAGGVAEENILNDLMVGLTTLDAAGRPIPGMAESWAVSPDGKVWTFHLRKAQRSDGTPVTAGDFVFAWRRLLDPKTASRYAYNLWLLRNAKSVGSGKLPPQALGVEAPKPGTLILTLEHPAPYLPELLTHPSALPLPRMAAKNMAWARPGSYVGNGPYTLKDWVPGDTSPWSKIPASMMRRKSASPPSIISPSAMPMPRYGAFGLGRWTCNPLCPPARLLGSRPTCPARFMSRHRWPSPISRSILPIRR